ncbi:hypothetical protein [Anianabacter salinae]|uniref:hypothetical protein n=1 Tax=Anianabacter salinae TaxID=2851023 RepID=UPI00225E2DD2|nr:hypothetical protein [Anianabacter salinae]MBV0913843.1 hypothetical protein [Anianabacter salinae]
MIRTLGLAFTLAAALPAAAHDLRVFASVTGDTVTVESKFSTGRIPNAGEVRVLDASDTLVMTLPLGEDGVTTFALPDGAADGGLMIEVDVSEGHSDYWLLTPDDIAHGQGTN